MENIINILLVVVIAVGLTIFFINNSDKARQQGVSSAVEKVTEPWGKIMFWAFIIIFGIYLLLFGDKY